MNHKNIKIPDGWEIEKLDQIGDFKNGINKGKDDFGHGMPFVNLMDVFGKTYLVESNFRLVNSTEKERQEYNLLKGDILFVRSSVKPEGVGLTSLITTDLKNTIFSGFLIRFRIYDNQLELEFKKHCFCPTYFRRALLKRSTISANTNINQQSLKTLNLIIPPLHEQRKIAEILSTWDMAIDKMEKLIEAKTQNKKALMLQLLTGKKRFKEFENEEWEKKGLGEFLVYEPRPVDKPKKAYWALGIRSHGKGTFKRGIEEPEKVMMDTLYEVKKDDLIVNITFAWEGAIAITKKEDEGLLVSHRFPTYVFKKNIAISEYFKQVILTKYIVHKLGIISPGGAGRNRVLSKKDFLRLQLKIPSIKEQQKIASVLGAADNEIELLTKQLDALKKQKRGLMQKLLTGKIRVKVKK